MGFFKKLGTKGGRLAFHNQRCQIETEASLPCPAILDIVIQLIDFLQKNDKSQDELYEINRLQTEKRRRKLTEDEIHYLISIKQSGIPLQYQLAANVLLGSFQEAQMIYEILPDDERQTFDAFPIRALWKQ